MSAAPFVDVVVVRCSSPTSARTGDRARVFADGTIEGFVGGSCADSTVRLQALRCLETAEPVLLKIVPGEVEGPASDEGAVVVSNPCLSGGALELFLEPRLPAPRVAIAGESPVARALAGLCASVGLDGRLDAAASDGDFACVVASLGHGDEDFVRRGIEAGCEYVGLVASSVRGAAVIEEVRASGVDVSRVVTPAGLAIGARTHEEIALSILAQIVQVRRTPAVPSAGPPAATLAAPEPEAPAAGGSCCHHAAGREAAAH